MNLLTLDSCNNKPEIHISEPDVTDQFTDWLHSSEVYSVLSKMSDQISIEVSSISSDRNMMIYINLYPKAYTSNKNKCFNLRTILQITICSIHWARKRTKGSIQ